MLTKNDVGDSVARIYDKNFDLTCEVTRAGYAYSIGFLSSDKLYVCESYSSNATLYTNVVVYTVGKDDIDLIAVVMGAEDGKVRFKEAASLLNFGFSVCNIYRDENDFALQPLEVKGAIQDIVKIGFKDTGYYGTTTLTKKIRVIK